MVCPCSVQRAGMWLPLNGLADARVYAGPHDDAGEAPAGAALVSGDGGKLRAGAEAEDALSGGAGDGAGCGVVDAAAVLAAGGAGSGVEAAGVEFAAAGGGFVAAGFP
jgi:hypothetical protein